MNPDRPSLPDEDTRPAQTGSPHSPRHSHGPRENEELRRTAIGEPLRTAYSREELLTKAQDWLKKNFPGNGNEWYHTRLGLLVDFITYLFPDEP
jgi:hypothetical protein